MSLAFDEYGRPFLIVREQQAKGRLKGLAAQKVRTALIAARTIEQLVCRLTSQLRGKWQRLCAPRSDPREWIR